MRINTRANEEIRKADKKSWPRIWEAKQSFKKGKKPGDEEGVVFIHNASFNSLGESMTARFHNGNFQGFV